MTSCLHISHTNFWGIFQWVTLKLYTCADKIEMVRKKLQVIWNPPSLIVKRSAIDVPTINNFVEDTWTHFLQTSSPMTVWIYKKKCWKDGRWHPGQIHWLQITSCSHISLTFEGFFQGVMAKFWQQFSKWLYFLWNCFNYCHCVVLGF